MGTSLQTVKSEVENSIAISIEVSDDYEIPQTGKNSEYSCKKFPTQGSEGQEEVKSGGENSIHISIEASDDDEIPQSGKNSEDSCKKIPTQRMTKAQEQSDEISTDKSEKTESEYEPLNHRFKIVAAVCCCCSWFLIC